MARPQTPLAKAKLTGQDKKHPDRFKKRSEPKLSGAPVGNPPAHLSKSAKQVWKEAVSDMGWLTREDRLALENLSNAVGQARDLVKLGELIPASMLAAINTAIGKIGASPTDRGKVFQQTNDEDEDDPFKRFMQ
jgi:phage terminase small subunit